MYILKGLKEYSLLRVITYKKETGWGVGTADRRDFLLHIFVYALNFYTRHVSLLFKTTIKKVIREIKKAYEIFK